MAVMPGPSRSWSHGGGGRKPSPTSVSGWRILALFLVAAAARRWSVPVETVFHNTWVQVGGAVVMALASLVLGAVGVFGRKDHSARRSLGFFAVLAEVLLLVGILALMRLGLVRLE